MLETESVFEELVIKQKIFIVYLIFSQISCGSVIDQRIVWYGSINLLSFGSAEESIMRLESPNIANELIKIGEKRNDIGDN